MKHLYLLLLIATLNLTAYSQSILTPEEEDLLYEQQAAAYKQEMLSNLERFQDPCSVGINASVSVIYFEDYSEVQITADVAGGFHIVDDQDNYIASIRVSPQFPAYDAIIKWQQDSKDIQFDDYLYANDQLSDFDKNFILQGTMFQGISYANGSRAGQLIHTLKTLL